MDSATADRLVADVASLLQSTECNVAVVSKHRSSIDEHLGAALQARLPSAWSFVTADAAVAVSPHDDDGAVSVSIVTDRTPLQVADRACGIGGQMDLNCHRVVMITDDPFGDVAARVAERCRRGRCGLQYLYPDGTVVRGAIRSLTLTGMGADADMERSAAIASARANRAEPRVFFVDTDSESWNVMCLDDLLTQLNNPRLVVFTEGQTRIVSLAHHLRDEFSEFRTAAVHTGMSAQEQSETAQTLAACDGFVLVLEAGLAAGMWASFVGNCTNVRAFDRVPDSPWLFAHAVLLRPAAHDRTAPSIVYLSRGDAKRVGASEADAAAPLPDWLDVFGMSCEALPADYLDFVHQLPVGNGGSDEQR